MFPLDRWYVAGLSYEFPADSGTKPVARTILGHPVVLYRAGTQMAALEDRCCHRHVPLSWGTLEPAHAAGPAIRCGYHGLAFGANGQCIDIPGQTYIPKNLACVRAFPVEERNQIVWIWMGRTPDSQPTEPAPAHPWHDDPAYQFSGDRMSYQAPYQLIHDNLLDLTHLGYVHTRTIGGNAAVHVSAEMTIEDGPDWVRVVRHMRNCAAPPTYLEAWPFTGNGMIDRWQEIEFRISHFLIWTGGFDTGTADLADPARPGFHMRGFHGITPETETTSHYFWTISSNRNPARPETQESIHNASALTFEEDRLIIEAQHANMLRFPGAPATGIHVDKAPNLARRIITRLTS
jgi:phenylpropionate dioxygenase-like ring-hydroxylating dioxygenase large terminal subunit